MNGTSPFCTEYRRLNAAGDYLPRRKAGLPPSGCAKNFRGFFRVMLLPNCWQERFFASVQGKNHRRYGCEKARFFVQKEEMGRNGMYPVSIFLTIFSRRTKIKKYKGNTGGKR